MGWRALGSGSWFGGSVWPLDAWPLDRRIQNQRLMFADMKKQREASEEKAQQHAAKVKELEKEVIVLRALKAQAEKRAAESVESMKAKYARLAADQWYRLEAWRLRIEILSEPL